MQSLGNRYPPWWTASIFILISLKCFMKFSGGSWAVEKKRENAINSLRRKTSSSICVVFALDWYQILNNRHDNYTTMQLSEWFRLEIIRAAWDVLPWIKIAQEFFVVVSNEKKKNKVWIKTFRDLTRDWLLVIRIKCQRTTVEGEIEDLIIESIFASTSRKKNFPRQLSENLFRMFLNQQKKFIQLDCKLN